MKKILLTILFYIIVFILLALYLIIIGILLTFLFNILGVPKTEYNVFKKLLLLIIASLLAKFTLFPIIGFIGSVFKKKF